MSEGKNFPLQVQERLVREITEDLKGEAKDGRIEHETLRRTIRRRVEDEEFVGQLESSSRVAKILRRLKDERRIIPTDDGGYTLKGIKRNTPTPVPAKPRPEPEPEPVASQPTPVELRGQLIVLNTLRPPPPTVTLKPDAKPLLFLADHVFLEDKFGGKLPYQISRWLAFEYFRRAPKASEGSEFRVLRLVGFMRSCRRPGGRRDEWFVTPEGRACDERLETPISFTNESAEEFIRERGFATGAEVPKLLARLSELEPLWREADVAWRKVWLDDDGSHKDISEHYYTLDRERDELLRLIGPTRLPVKQDAKPAMSTRL